MKLLKGMCLIGLLLFLFACSQNDSANEGSNMDDSAQDGAGLTESSDDAEGEREMDQSDEQSGAEPTEGEIDFDTMNQMIIYNGRIELETNNYQEINDMIRDELSNRNGYIVRSNEHTRGEEEQRYGEIEVRIPQEHFDPFMNSLEAENVHVLNKTQESEDVTEEYVDLESRLTAKEAVEERLLNFMENAEKTEDLLQISDDLSQVQEEIEQIKGRMNYIENHVAYSTVTISIQERNVKIPEVQSQEELNTMAKAKKLFLDTINVFMSIGSGLVVFFVGLSPILIPLAIIALIILFKFRQSKKRE
ncbi:DUF4349 domain-containing protein [Aquisalibacillus elongatus]|uniref:Uncharacterized protein DUF4349 n=1 Tax=Aquisalibacillus elongatus TaxID=485577 RepID=A0A3N5B3H4_9BACI|nr:DUF4349 domain-containing protein [Aquisalibacillus elongatus]RPF50100.1 uncharacterized protein DUF4349 [Aquisalibacillus elongatus]